MNFTLIIFVGESIRISFLAYVMIKKKKKNSFLAYVMIKKKKILEDPFKLQLKLDIGMSGYRINPMSVCLEERMSMQLKSEMPRKIRYWHTCLIILLFKRCLSKSKSK